MSRSGNIICRVLRPRPPMQMVQPLAAEMGHLNRRQPPTGAPANRTSAGSDLHLGGVHRRLTRGQREMRSLYGNGRLEERREVLEAELQTRFGHDLSPQFLRRFLGEAELDEYDELSEGVLTMKEMVERTRVKRGTRTGGECFTQTDLNVRISECTAAEDILALVDEAVDGGVPLSEANKHHALFTIARILPKEKSTGIVFDKRVIELVSGLENRLRRGLLVTPRALSQLAWSVGRLKLTGPPASSHVLDTIARRVLGMDLATFGARDLSMCVCAYAHAGHKATPLFNAFATEISSRNPEKLGKTECMRILWAYAKARHAAPAMFRALDAQLLRGGSVEATQLEEMVTVLWSNAVMGLHEQPLFTAVTAAVQKRGVETIPFDILSRLVWASAKIGHAQSDLLSTVRHTVLRRDLRQVAAHDMSRMMWGFAQLAHSSRPLYDSLAGEALRRGPQTFSSHSLSSMVWAYGQGNMVHDGFFHAVQEVSLNMSLKRFITLEEARDWSRLSAYVRQVRLRVAECSTKYGATDTSSLKIIPADPTGSGGVPSH